MCPKLLWRKRPKGYLWNLWIICKLIILFLIISILFKILSRSSLRLLMQFVPLLVPPCLMWFLASQPTKLFTVLVGILRVSLKPLLMLPRLLFHWLIWQNIKENIQGKMLTKSTNDSSLKDWSFGCLSIHPNKWCNCCWMCGDIQAVWCQACRRSWCSCISVWSSFRQGV